LPIHPAKRGGLDGFRPSSGRRRSDRAASPPCRGSCGSA
jgi:hypothetical protein